jgi:lipoprotein-anchoring transpeptidase ErfK/SrfK
VGGASTVAARSGESLSLTDSEAGDAILVNVPQRMPLGEYEIDERVTDKPWIVPRSIQEEMRREGKPVLTIVPPGPDNPLGRHWLGLSRVSCGIHGTIVPASI